MAGETLGEVIRRLGRSGGLQGELAQTDAQLLDRFARRRDEPAFAALMARHGPMVLGLCRRLLPDPRDAEDAFQAAFLVLARRAGAIQRRTLLGQWLYGVAWRVAVRLRGRAIRRREHEQSGVDFDALPAHDAAWSDVRWVVHEEVQRLPDAYRSAVVLCCLEGKTNEEAARLLRRPVGTVKSRLTRARELLRTRLARRGMGVSVGAVGTALAAAPATASAALMDATIRAVPPFVASGATAGGAVSARAVALSQGVLRTMMLKKATFAAALILAVAVFGGAGGWTYRSWAAAAGGDPKAPALVVDRSKGEAPKDQDKPKDDKADEIAEQASHLPKDAQSLLEQAEELEVYSLNPPSQQDEPPKGKDALHGFKVLGKTTVKDPAARKKLVDAIEKGIAENVGVAGCFNPRHAIRATHDGKTVDLVICFECFSIQVTVSDKQSFMWTNAEPQEALDKVLRDAGVPLAPKPDEKSDKEALQGVWRVESVQVAGEEVTDKALASRGIMVPREWVVNDDAIVFNGLVKHSCPFKLDPDKKPKEIDITPMLHGYTLDPGPGPPNRGVYSLDGDVWKVCFPRDTSLEYAGFRERPKEVASTKEYEGTPPVGTMLISLKRVKTDQDKPGKDKPGQAQPADGKGPAKTEAPAAKYDIVADAAQPAGSPVLLKLVVTNTGKEPIEYWLGGPGSYPAVFWFAKTAKATDAAGKTRESPLSNGGFIGGISGVVQSLGPGDSVTIPAAMDPLPEGAYLIEVGGGSAKVTVKDDADLLKKREDDLLARIGKGEPFAQYVAATYMTPSLRERLLRDLSATDYDTAWHAAETLYSVEKLPADTVPLLAQAMDKQLALESSRQKRSTNVLVYVAEMAGRIGSDEALEPVLKLAHSELGEAAGLRALGMFKQERAVKELHDFLKDAREDMRYEAALVLADRRDPGAVEVLLAITADRKSSWRGFACQALAKFPDDPRVEPAIRSLLHDREAALQAKQALEQLHALQKK